MRDASSSSSLPLSTLRTLNGRYLGIRHGKAVAIATLTPVIGDAVHVTVGAEERFEVEVDGDASVVIKLGEQFLGVADGSVALVDGPFIWQATAKPAGVTLETEEGRFLSAKGGGGGDVELSHKNRVDAKNTDVWVVDPPLAFDADVDDEDGDEPPVLGAGTSQPPAPPPPAAAPTTKQPAPVPAAVSKGKGKGRGR